jgi:hypothetical protein
MPVQRLSRPVIVAKGMGAGKGGFDDYLIHITAIG